MTGRIQLEVFSPMPHSSHGLVGRLIEQRQVVVRIGILGRDFQRGLIMLQSFYAVAALVVQIGQIEMSQRVVRIGRQGI